MLQPNGTPSFYTEDEEISLFKRREETIQDLKDADAELQLVRMKYQEILKRKATLRRDLLDLAEILNPIRKLPSELLQLIFKFLLDTGLSRSQPFTPPFYSNSVTKIQRQAPWNISMVCRRWRAVALSCASLWRYLGVQVPVVPKPGYFHLIECQIARAAGKELYVSFRVPLGLENLNVAEEAMLFLVPSAKRWRTLILDLPAAVLAKLGTLFTRLVSLREIELHVSTQHLLDQDTLPLSLEWSPQLKHVFTTFVSLCCIELEFGRDTSPKVYLCSAEATGSRRSLARAHSSQVYHFLQHCADAKDFTTGVQVQVPVGRGAVGTRVPEYEITQMPNLSRLSAWHEPEAIRILEFVATPSLKHLSFYIKKVDNFQLVQTRLSRSKCRLTSLSVRLAAFMTGNPIVGLISFLGLCPTLEILQVRSWGADFIEAVSSRLIQDELFLPSLTRLSLMSDGWYQPISSDLKSARPMVKFEYANLEYDDLSKLTTGCSA